MAIVALNGLPAVAKNAVDGDGGADPGPDLQQKQVALSAQIGVLFHVYL